MNLDKIPPNVLRDVRAFVLENRLYCRKPAMSDSEVDRAVDAHIAMSSAKECFEAFLVWNGIVGYTETLWSAVEGLKAAE